MSNDQNQLSRRGFVQTAALAAGVNVAAYKSLITVQPWIQAKVAGDGIPAWMAQADWPSGQAHPNPETFTVASTAEPQALTTQAPALAIDAPDLRMLWTVPGGNVVQEAQTAAG